MTTKISQQPPGRDVLYRVALMTGWRRLKKRRQSDVVEERKRYERRKNERERREKKSVEA